MLSFLSDACVFIALYSCLFVCFIFLRFQRRAFGCGVIEALLFWGLFFFIGPFHLIGSGPSIMCENVLFCSVLRRGGGRGLTQLCTNASPEALEGVGWGWEAGL